MATNFSVFLLPLGEKVAEGRMRGCAASAAQRVIGAQARHPLTRSLYLQELGLQALSPKGERAKSLPALPFTSDNTCWIRSVRGNKNND